MDAAYETLRGVIPLYRDYHLRILCEDRDRTKKLMQAESTLYEKARRSALQAQARLESWRQICELLKETSNPLKAAKFQKALDKYPSEDVLRQQAKAAAIEKALALVGYQHHLEVYKKVIAKVNVRRAFVLWVDETYSTSFAQIFEQFGNIELFCKCSKSDEGLDVFFGGYKRPNGIGHAHWVFNRQGIAVYTRNPTIVAKQS